MPQDPHFGFAGSCRYRGERGLFMGAADSGARAATFYTLIGNAHREGINAESYLTDIFKRLPRETNQTVNRLTPKAWAAEQAAQRQALAQSTTTAM